MPTSPYADAEAVKKLYGDKFYSAVVDLTKNKKVKGDAKVEKAKKLFEEYSETIESTADSLFTELVSQPVTPEMAYHIVVRFLQKYYEAMGDPNPQVALPRPGEKFTMVKEKLDGKENKEGKEV